VGRGGKRREVGRRPPLDRQLRVLDDAVRQAYDDDADIDAALVPDMQVATSLASSYRHQSKLSLPCRQSGMSLRT
jgi:hypothetical protein